MKRQPVGLKAVTDANAVWRELAAMSSFGWSHSLNDQLYLPCRSSHLAGSSPALLRFLLSKYEALADTPNPYLKRATAQALALCRNRIRLAEANEHMGNTPTSQIRQFEQNVFAPAVQYAFLREADRANWEESLEKRYPDCRGVVTEGPMSAESRQKLDELFKGAGGLKEDIQKRTVMSGLLAYADMAQVDRTVAFWQTWLMPLVKRCSGPASDKPLVEISAAWHDLKGKDSFQPLNCFNVRNVAGQELTHVTVCLLAENPWGEKAYQYYYFPQLGVAEVDFLLAHPRWAKRRLPFTNSLTVTCFVWADQGSFTNQIKLTSPAPDPDPETARKNFLDYDKQYQAQGEDLGAVVQNMYHVPVFELIGGGGLLPIDPTGQRRRLKAAVAPGTSYIFNVPGEGKSVRTLVLRFVRLDEGLGAIEATVIDQKNGKPFDENTPVWKGQLANSHAGKIFLFGTSSDGKTSAWSCGINRNDSFRIACSGGGAPGAAFPVKDIWPFAVRTP